MASDAVHDTRCVAIGRAVAISAPVWSGCVIPDAAQPARIAAVARTPSRTSVSPPKHRGRSHKSPRRCPRRDAPVRLVRNGLLWQVLPTLRMALRRVHGYADLFAAAAVSYGRERRGPGDDRLCASREHWLRGYRHPRRYGSHVRTGHDRLERREGVRRRGTRVLRLAWQRVRCRGGCRLVNAHRGLTVARCAKASHAPDGPATAPDEQVAAQRASAARERPRLNLTSHRPRLPSQRPRPTIGRPRAYRLLGRGVGGSGPAGRLGPPDRVGPRVHWVQSTWRPKGCDRSA